MAIRSNTPTLTYYAVRYGPNGKPRPFTVSLPYVASISDEPHYAAPPPPPSQERAPAMTDRAIRRTLSRDPENSARLRAQAIMRRVMVFGL